MEPETLHEMVEKVMSLHDNRIAVREDTGSSSQDLVYKELWHVSGLIADRISSIDVPSPQAFIGVCMDQCLLLPAVILGILRQGSGFACVDPTWTLEKQINMLKKLGIIILIHTGKPLQESTCSEKQYSFEILGMFLHLEKFNFSQLLRKCPHSMAYAVLTSGSTGDAKIVRVPHSSIVPNILSLREVLHISHEDVIFLSSPSTFDPSVVDLFLALSSGASLLVTTRSMKGSATNLLSVLFPTEHSDKGVSVLQMTPSLFNRWSDSELKDIVFGPKTTLRSLILGGEPFPPLSKFKHCQASTNLPIIYNIYGITEVSVWASIFQVLPPTPNFQNIHGFDTGNPVLLGEPLSETFFQVRDCTSGSIIHAGYGELLIGSCHRVCEVDNENCLDYCLPVYRATGDIVKVHPNGNICYSGRKDRSIKRWGHRVNMESIEHIALSYPGIQSACSVWDERENKLFLAVKAHEEVFSQVDLQRHLLQCVGSEKALIPDEIVQVQDSSLTSHGKLNHQMIIEMMQTRKSSHRGDSVSKLFLQLCAEVLGLFSVTEGSFFHLGGNSLLAMTLIAKLENTFGDVPQDLPSMLLSEESLLDISKKLCLHYDERTTNSKALQPLIVEWKSAQSERSEKEAFAPTTSRSNSNHPPILNSDKLISCSIRGRTSSERATYCSINQKTVKNTTMNVSWKRDLHKCIDASPLCMVYESGIIGIVIGSHSGAFTFLNGTTGESRWSVYLPNRIESSACSSMCGRYVYVGCYDGALYCICTVSGNIEWAFTTGAMIKCTPALCNEGRSVLFGSYDYNVYCVSAETGELEWRNSFGDRGSWIASPLVIDKLAILCSLASKAYAVQTSDGQVLWSISFQQPIFSTPSSFSCAGDTNIVIADVKGTIHCLRLSSGRELTYWQAPGHVFAPLTILQDSTLRCVAQNLILVACYDQHIYALSIKDSTEMSLHWKINLGARIGSAPYPFVIGTDENVMSACAAVVNSAGRVFIISLDDGRIFCQYDVHSEVFSSSVVVQGRVYFGCRDNNFYCLEIK